MVKIETDNDYRQRLIVRETCSFTREGKGPDNEILARYSALVAMRCGETLDFIGGEKCPRINLDTFVLPENIKEIYTARSDPSKTDLFSCTGKIAAIKLMREHLFMGLKQAKDIIEFIVERDGLKTWHQSTLDCARANPVPEKKTPEQNLKLQQEDFIYDARVLMCILTYDQLQEVIDCAMQQQRVIFLTLQEQKRQDESERSVLKKHLKD